MLLIDNIDSKDFLTIEKTKPNGIQTIRFFRKEDLFRQVFKS